MFYLSVLGKELQILQNSINFVAWKEQQEKMFEIQQIQSN